MPVRIALVGRLKRPQNSKSIKKQASKLRRKPHDSYFHGLPARIRALRNKVQGWQTVGGGSRGNGTAMT
jgi:hypothetical protein